MLLQLISFNNRYLIRTLNLNVVISYMTSIIRTTILCTMSFNNKQSFDCLPADHVLSISISIVQHSYSRLMYLKENIISIIGIKNCLFVIPIPYFIVSCRLIFLVVLLWIQTAISAAVPVLLKIQTSAVKKRTLPSQNRQ